MDLLAKEYIPYADTCWGTLQPGSVHDDKQNPEGLDTRREIARAKRSLLFIFGVGAVGVAFGITWVVRNSPKGELPGTYTAGPAASFKEGQKSPPRPCRKFGDTCEYSPNKLGSCMERVNCAGQDCLFCQSQH